MPEPIVTLDEESLRSDLRAMAILSASSASSAAMLADIDQPAVILDHTSIATAGQGHPRWVLA